MSLPRRLKTQSKSINKQSYKKKERKCRICGEDNYYLLDVHRIQPGAEGGKYTKANSVVLCCSCHRKEQNEEIIIYGWKNILYDSLLHIIDENGEEKFI